jgi:hypothetical protein
MEQIHVLSSCDYTAGYSPRSVGKDDVLSPSLCWYPAASSYFVIYLILGKEYTGCGGKLYQ